MTVSKFSKITLFIFLISFTFSWNSVGQNKEGMATSIERGMVKPPYLKKGDTIMILAPAGRLKEKSSVDAGIELANQWGLVVFLGNHLFSQQNGWAGSESDRIEDLQKALDDPSIKAIWAARGGYGTVRIIDELDFTKFYENPKWIIGYSDITVLHSKMTTLGYESIHGQMPLTLELENPVQKESIVALYKSLFGKKLSYKLNSTKYNRTGESTGQLVGGNLSLVYSVLASDIDLNMNGKILFIEDIDENFHSVDRMMNGLKRAGYFKNCKGLIVGDFAPNKHDGNNYNLTIEKIMLDAVEGTNFPVIFNFPAGHIDDNRALIFGSYIDLKVTDKKAKVVFK